MVQDKISVFNLLNNDLKLKGLSSEIISTTFCPKIIAIISIIIALSQFLKKFPGPSLLIPFLTHSTFFLIILHFPKVTCDLKISMRPIKFFRKNYVVNAHQSDLCKQLLPNARK